MVAKWNPTNLRDREPNLQSKNHEDHNVRKRFTSGTHYSLVNKCNPMPQAMQIPYEKPWTSSGRSSRLLQSRARQEVALEGQRNKVIVHFPSLVDICHQNKAEFEPKLQKYRGRVVLRRDIVMDDSGAYAVFTVQGSTASQMTCCKNHGRLRSITKLSSRCSFRLYSGKNWRCTKLGQTSQEQSVQMFGYFFHDTSGQNHSKKLKIPWKLLN